jgi:hypothetical protein
LLRVYQTIHPQQCKKMTVENLPQICKMYSWLTYREETYGSMISTRQRKYCHVLACWYGQSGEGGDIEQRPAIIKYFIRHTLTIDGNIQYYLFAVSKWFKRAPNNLSKSNLKTLHHPPSCQFHASTLSLHTTRKKILRTHHRSW